MRLKSILRSSNSKITTSRCHQLYSKLLLLSISPGRKWGSKIRLPGQKNSRHVKNQNKPNPDIIFSFVSQNSKEMKITLHPDFSSDSISAQKRFSGSWCSWGPCSRAVPGEPITSFEDCRNWINAVPRFSWATPGFNDFEELTGFRDDPSTSPRPHAPWILRGQPQPGAHTPSRLPPPRARG